MIYSEYRISDIRQKINSHGLCYPIDVMITGVTGAGKSTTLNAIFQKSIAKVGDGANPETMELDSYRLSDWLRLWDTPGLGDGVKQDKIHANTMQKLLTSDIVAGSDLYGYIDMVIVVIEGTKRDLGTTRALLNDVILPNIESNRVLVVVNQADMAMKGKNWNFAYNCPNSELLSYLEDFATSIQRRVKEDTNLIIPKPIFYSAEKKYNIDKLLDFIIDHIPVAKRAANDIKYKKGGHSVIQIDKPTYYYEKDKDWVLFEFEKLKNKSYSNDTGDMKVFCWISALKYGFTNGFANSEHYLIDARWLGHLNGGRAFFSQRMYFNFPQSLKNVHGSYHFVFTIQELADDGEWHVIDFVNFDSRYISID